MQQIIWNHMKQLFLFLFCFFFLESDREEGNKNNNLKTIWLDVPHLMLWKKNKTKQKQKQNSKNVIMNNYAYCSKCGCFRPWYKYLQRKKNKFSNSTKSNFNTCFLHFLPTKYSPMQKQNKQHTNMTEHKYGRLWITIIDYFMRIINLFRKRFHVF